MDVELRGITKRFPGVVAVDGVDLTVGAGEVLALLGENGAGKSTLMNVLYGLLEPDEGEVLLDGAPLQARSPADAIAAGIGMVHQHFMLVPVFTVAENVMLGDEPSRAAPAWARSALGRIGRTLAPIGQALRPVTRRLGRALAPIARAVGWALAPIGRALGQARRSMTPIDRREGRHRVAELSERYGLAVDPDATVEDLPVGVQQRVEILKALYRDARCLILDEPTAVLTPPEIDELMGIIRQLADDGRSVIFISHKLREVLDVADRIAVLRGGENVGETTPADADVADLARMMVGRDVQLVVDKTVSDTGSSVLEVRDLRVVDDRGQAVVDGVSFDVRAGEIVALAGVQGNGQTELVQAITGLRAPLEGTVLLDEVDVTGASPGRMVDAGVAHVPEDRQRDGLVGSFSVEDNLVLNQVRRPPFSRAGGLMIDRGAVRRHATQLVDDFDVRTPSTQAEAQTLSGGNQQKVIVARELTLAQRLLILVQPTRGLDVGSIQYIHRQIVERRDAGLAVLVVSTELDEVLALGDRIAVMYRGQIADVLDRSEAHRDVVGCLMAGIIPSAAEATIPLDGGDHEVVVT